MKQMIINIKNVIFGIVRKIKNNRLLRSILKRQESKYEMNNWLALFLQFLFSIFLEFLIEVFSRHSVLKALQFVTGSSQAFLYNALLIFVWSLIVFLFRKRKLARIIVFTTWFILGLSNGIILSNRVTPLTGPDLKNVNEALGVVKKYFNTTQIILAIIFIVLLLIFIFIYIFRCPLYKGKMNYVINIIAIACCVFTFSKYTEYCLNNNILSSYFSNIAFAYQDYGFPYCFTVTITDTGINEPNNYSNQSVDDIVNLVNEKVKETTANLKYKPNVIVVQLESFFDPSRVNYFETNIDPIPHWHELCSKYTSGYLTVPTIGAGTVNTEFEILTGMSMRFFGAGEYPYKGILQDNVCESSAFIMKDLGYTCFALHNNEANFYSRKKVYKNLGFDYFISGEYMLNQNDVNENGWMRDRNLIKPILDTLDSTDGTDYVFTVSVQPHGSYPTEQVYEDPIVKVSGENLSDDKKYAWEYYVNQLYEEDQFVYDLINAVKARKERTVVVFYGDHQPTMNLSNSDLSDGSVYETCYLVWDNLRMKQIDEDITSYQLFAKVLDKLDIHEGNIFRLQQSNFDGTDEEFIPKLQTLQYDILYGERYLYDEDYYTVSENYRLGLVDPIIESYSEMAEGIYILSGKNFTKSSKVFIDKEMVETVFLNENELLLIHTTIGEHSKIRVGVQSNSSTHKILSYGPYYYVDPMDDPINKVTITEEIEDSIEEEFDEEEWLIEIEDKITIDKNGNR